MTDLNVDPWVAWCLAAAALLVIEMLTPGLFYFACFALAALAAAVASSFEVPLPGVWGVFFLVGLGSVLATRPAVEKLTKGKGRPSNVDELIGRDALVKTVITPFAAGVVTIGTEDWRARATEEIAPGTVVRIHKIDGSSVLVERKE
jgi:membrane protein implicated in regulation of membrane protease activity